MQTYTETGKIPPCLQANPYRLKTKNINSHILRILIAIYVNDFFVF